MGWIEEKIERWLGLEINRDKTRVVNLKEEKASLDFLGYTFRWDRDLYGSNRRYLNVEPSKKALQRQRDRLNELTDRRQGCTPIPRLITKLNRQLKGWANYFSYGYPRKAFRKINWHLGYRLANHLKHHRSQRPYRLPEGMTYYDHLQRLGLQFLQVQPGDSRGLRFSGEPDAGNLHVRFDEGTAGRVIRRSLSYSTGIQVDYMRSILLSIWPLRIFVC